MLDRQCGVTGGVNETVWVVFAGMVAVCCTVIGLLRRGREAVEDLGAGYPQRSRQGTEQDGVVA
jgi:hypothetical protein